MFVFSRYKNVIFILLWLILLNFLLIFYDTSQSFLSWLLFNFINILIESIIILIHGRRNFLSMATTRINFTVIRYSTLNVHSSLVVFVSLDSVFPSSLISWILKMVQTILLISILLILCQT